MSACGQSLSLSFSLCFSVASLTDSGLGRMGVCEGGCRWTTNALGNAAENTTMQAGLPKHSPCAVPMDSYVVVN